MAVKEPFGEKEAFKVRQRRPLINDSSHEEGFRYYRGPAASRKKVRHSYKQVMSGEVPAKVNGMPGSLNNDVLTDVETFANRSLRVSRVHVTSPFKITASLATCFRKGYLVVKCFFVGLLSLLSDAIMPFIQTQDRPDSPDF